MTAQHQYEDATEPLHRPAVSLHCVPLDDGTWEVHDPDTRVIHIATPTTCDCSYFTYCRAACRHICAVKREMDLLAVYSVLWDHYAEPRRQALP